MAEPAASQYGLRTLVWIVVVVAGAAVWLLEVNGLEAGRAWRALLTCFLFFTPLAGGLVVWPAIVRTCNGRWHQGMETMAASGIGFAVPSILVLALLWSGSPVWSPWYRTSFHQGLWLHNSFVFGRDLAGLLLFWGLAVRYLWDRRSGGGRFSGPLLILVYCLVFSLIGFDLVMALDPSWFSTLAGGYFFMSGLYIGITAWTFLAVVRDEAVANQRHDLGKLILAFSLMSAYLMYSHLLPIWYENLPHEVRFVVPRAVLHPWKTVSLALVALVYLGPLVMLLTEASKRNRLSLGLISLVILIGMWIERWWLVVPVFQQNIRFGLLEIATLAAFTGILAITLERFERQMPATLLREEN